MGAVTPAEILQQRRGEPGSQATRVEQSRAVAEVQAAFTIAAARPRDPTKALNQILESCKMKSVAESAFFKFPRGGNVTGETIHLAVEMARCWGNISYSIAELERDDGAAFPRCSPSPGTSRRTRRAGPASSCPHKRDKEGNKPSLAADLDARHLREQRQHGRAPAARVHLPGPADLARRKTPPGRLLRDAGEQGGDDRPCPCASPRR
jgi:hypothetical protein